MRRFTLSLIVVILSFAPFSMAADIDSKTYRFASYYIPLLVQDSNTGALVELLQEAAKRADIQYEIITAPPKRAMRYFEDEEVIAIIPALLTTLGKNGALTRPIFSKPIHAIVRKGKVLPKSIEDLEGSRVGLTRGYSFPRSITVNKKIVIDYADTTDASLKKLLEGRIDVLVADGYTVSSAINKMKLTGFTYDLSTVLHEQPVYVACQPTEEGRELAQKLSIAFDSMEADGTLGRILPDLITK